MYMYRDIAAIKAANRANGGHWFDKATMEFFDTRVLDGVIGGCLFVSSDRAPGGVRAYTIRQTEPSGDVHTADGTEFMGYETAVRACNAARKLAEDLLIEQSTQ